mgnify:FL=1|jgi:hypothetical protein
MLFNEVVISWLDINGLPLDLDIKSMTTELKSSLCEFVDWYYVGCDNPFNN